MNSWFYIAMVYVVVIVLRIVFLLTLVTIFCASLLRLRILAARTSTSLPGPAIPLPFMLLGHNLILLFYISPCFETRYDALARNCYPVESLIIFLEYIVRLCSSNFLLISI